MGLYSCLYLSYGCFSDRTEVNHIPEEVGHATEEWVPARDPQASEQTHQITTRPQKELLRLLLLLLLHHHPQKEVFTLLLLLLLHYTHKHTHVTTKEYDLAKVVRSCVISSTLKEANSEQKANTVLATGICSGTTKCTCRAAKTEWKQNNNKKTKQ